MQIKIGKELYEVLDTKEKITIADSFVVRQNKIGRGNGEAKLYVGHEDPLLRAFFGVFGFGLKCFLLKEDLLAYLKEIQIEYLKPEQPYIHKEMLPKLWKERIEKVKKLPNIIYYVYYNCQA